MPPGTQALCRILATEHPAVLFDDLIEAVEGYVCCVTDKDGEVVKEVVLFEMTDPDGDPVTVWSPERLSAELRAAYRISVPGVRPIDFVDDGRISAHFDTTQRVLCLLGQRAKIPGAPLLGATQRDWLKLALTYCVPFCVALYGAYSANRLRRRA